jgi:hypothetical protein
LEGLDQKSRVTYFHGSSVLHDSYRVQRL